ncbi:MAG: hypothetical protein IJW64_04435 [Clostridia bacterium]|nr:hypothetical protein [Clostridia bacterium]
MEEDKKYKILFWATIIIFIFDTLLRFAFEGHVRSLLGQLGGLIWLIIIMLIVISLSTIALFVEAKRGKIIGFSNKSVKSLSYLKIALVSFLIAFVYAFLMWYSYFLLNGGKDIGLFENMLRAFILLFTWFKFGFLVTILTVFVYVFAVLTIAWFIAKRNVEKCD